MRTIARFAVAVGICLSAASYTNANDIKINGFASIAAGTTLHASQQGNDQAIFIADTATGATYDDNLSFKPDSLYGLQITSDLGEGLSVVGQIIGSGGNNFDAQMSWGYIKYQFNDTYSTLAGRQRIPLYFYSDVLDVGYSYHWIRPPTDGAIPVDTLDGIQLRQDINLGDWDTRIQIFNGTSDGEAFKLDNINGLVAYASNDWLQLRASYMTQDVVLNFTGQEETIGADYWSVSAHATFGNLFVVGEYAENTVEKATPTLNIDLIDAGFISMGYNIGNLTPHITYSTEKYGFTNAPNNSAVAARTFNDSTIIIGSRWDFHPKAAFKIEYLTRTDDDKNARYLAYRNNTRVRQDVAIRETDLFALAIDVIF